MEKIKNEMPAGINNESETTEEIDLTAIPQTLFRNKLLIFGVTGITTTLSLIYAFSRVRLYQGEFQIVLRDKVDFQSSRININPELAKIAGFNKPSRDLSTEIEILRSPSILMPTYNYMKGIKADNNENTTQIKYRDWVKDSIKINLVRGTSVLNFKYKDNNKEHIRMILEKISNSYQDYSRKDKLTYILKGKEYLDNQIVIYKRKALDSQKRLLEHRQVYC